MSKLLIVNLHPNGGCFQYSNEIISRLKLSKTIFLNGKVSEKIPFSNFNRLRCYGFSLPIRYFDLFLFCLRIFFGGIIGHYNGLLLMGFTSWDPFISKAFSLTGRKIFYIVHDGKVHLGESDKSTQQRILTSINNSSNIVYLSKYVQTMMESSYSIKKDSVIVPHGLIDYGRKNSFRTNKGLAKILYIGRLSQYKGIDNLLTAIDLVNPLLYANLLIAGKSINGYQVKSDNSKVQIKDCWLSEFEIVDLLLNYDILVMPYSEGTQSGVATLAINYIMPTIVTDVGAFKEQFTSDGAFFIEDNEPESLKMAIEKLCTDKEIYDRLVGSLIRVRDKYSWNQIVLDFECYLNNQLS